MKCNIKNNDNDDVTYIVMYVCKENPKEFDRILEFFFSFLANRDLKLLLCFSFFFVSPDSLILVFFV